MDQHRAGKAGMEEALIDFLSLPQAMQFQLQVQKFRGDPENIHVKWNGLVMIWSNLILKTFTGF